MNRVSTSKLLVVAAGILVREKQLLVCETTRGHLELLSTVIGKAEDILPQFIDFLQGLGMGERPQQTLYLSSVTVQAKSKVKATGLVRIIRFSRAPGLDVPNSRFEPIKELENNEMASALLQAVSRWLLQTSRRT